MKIYKFLYFSAIDFKNVQKNTWIKKYVSQTVKYLFLVNLINVHHLYSAWPHWVTMRFSKFFMLHLCTSNRLFSSSSKAPQFGYDTSPLYTFVRTVFKRIYALKFSPSVAASIVESHRISTSSQFQHCWKEGLPVLVIKVW